ncbi:hypothetical protein [Azospirillum humicireducens]|uniref:hypothetical protein n=1 Tax=Azospirillum humicireducens TaxID=1226968 RepID=UPI0011B1EF3B|nr:hypothetical protein [Azospirillum humicireducens]
MTLVEVKAECKPSPGTQRFIGSGVVWAEVRRLKTFQTADLLVEGTTRKIANAFLRKAIQAGLVVVEKPGDGGWRGAVYRLVRDVGRRCPRFTADGRLNETPTPTERIWAAIKPLRGGFTVREVACLTRCTEDRVGQYVNALRRHGYLDVLVKSGGHREGRYRLKRSMNTGPDAPHVLRGAGKPVWDPNLGRLVEEVSE